ncbi:hypothetical protein [Paenibacillus doosanensis]|uniref:hypothetical protein n=1 Tax=Paenibacillus doosanensis TaxID=1229154 RepID=UPI0021809910|nr:hypothetical protein [Paenibacillus doosanensis]
MRTYSVRPVKAWVTLMVSIVMLGSIIACSSAPASSGGVQASSANAKKAMVIRKKEGGGEAFIINHLKKQGYQVMDVVDQDFTVDKANGYGVVYVSEGVNSSKMDAKLKTSKVPVVIAKNQAASDAGLVGVSQYGDEDKVRTVHILDSKHPLAAGLKDTVAIYKEEGKISYGLHPGKDAVVIAEYPASGSNKKVTIFGYEKGAKNINNEAVPARQVYFSLPTGEESKLTDDGWKLFDAAIAWAAANGGK